MRFVGSNVSFHIVSKYVACAISSHSLHIPAKMSAFNSHMQQNATDTTRSEPLKICCHVIVTQQTPIVEQCAHKFRNLPLQAKERI